MSDNEFHFASEVVDVSAHDLPGLKAAFVVRRVADGSVVVDVGCGGGKMLRTINEHRRGVTLLGCDVTEATDINGDFTFTALDRSTGRLPYEDSSVDIALLIDVLEHVNYPETTLSEIARILRPDGRMLAFVPIEGEPVSWFSVFRTVLGKDLYVRTKGHINSFTHDEFERHARGPVHRRRASIPLPLPRAAHGRGVVRGADHRRRAARVLDPQPVPRRKHRDAPSVTRRAPGRRDLSDRQHSRLG